MKEKKTFEKKINSDKMQAQQENLRRTPAELKLEFKKLQERIKSLYSLATQVYSMKPNETIYRFPDGTEYTRGDVRAMKSSVVRSVDDLQRIVKVSMKRKKTRKANLNSGFLKPVRVGQNLLGFVSEADLGNAMDYSIQKRMNPATGNDVKTLIPQDLGQPLKAQLALLTREGVASRVTLNALINIYIAKNNLVARATMNQGKDASMQNGLVFGADDLMRRWFSTTFDTLVQSSQLELSQLGVQNGQARPSPTKKGKQRKYYKNVKVNGVDTPDQSQPILNDFYFAFTPDNIPRSSINKILKYNLDEQAGDAENFKLTAEEAAAYQAQLDQMKAAGGAMNYRDAAARASQGMGQVSGQKIAIRGQVDQESAITRNTSKAYKRTK